MKTRLLKRKARLFEKLSRAKVFSLTGYSAIKMFEKNTHSDFAVKEQKKERTSLPQEERLTLVRS